MGGRLSIAIMVLGLGLGGCTTTSVKTTPDHSSSPDASSVSSSQPPPAERARVGDTIVLAGTSDAEHVAIRLLRVIDPLKVSRFVASKTARFVGIELAINNTGRAVYDDSPSNGALLIDSSDRQHEATFAEARGELASVRLSHGERRVGIIAFKLPRGVVLKGFTFTLDSGFGPQTGEWLLG